MVPDEKSRSLQSDRRQNSIKSQIYENDERVKSDGRNDRKLKRGKIPVYVGSQLDAGGTIRRNINGELFMYKASRSLENLSKASKSSFDYAVVPHNNVYNDDNRIYRDTNTTASRRQSVSCEDVTFQPVYSNNNTMSIPKIGARKKRKQWYESKDMSRSADDLSFPGATFNRNIIPQNRTDLADVKSKSCNDILGETDNETLYDQKKAHSAGSGNPHEDSHHLNKKKRLLIKSTKLCKDRNKLIRDVMCTSNHAESSYLFITAPAESSSHEESSVKENHPRKEHTALERNQEIDMLFRREPKAIRKEPIGMSERDDAENFVYDGDNNHRNTDKKKKINKKIDPKKYVQVYEANEIQKGMNTNINNQNGDDDNHNVSMDSEHSFVFNQKSISEESNAIINKILLKKKLKESSKMLDSSSDNIDYSISTLEGKLKNTVKSLDEITDISENDDEYEELEKQYSNKVSRNRSMNTHKYRDERFNGSDKELSPISSESVDVPALRRKQSRKDKHQSSRRNQKENNYKKEGNLYSDYGIDVTHTKNTANGQMNRSKSKGSMHLVSRKTVCNDDIGNDIRNESSDSIGYDKKFEPGPTFSLDLDDSSASLLAGTGILEMSSGLVANSIPSKYDFRISLDESQTASQSGHFIKNLIFNENNEWKRTPRNVQQDFNDTPVNNKSSTKERHEGYIETSSSNTKKKKLGNNKLPPNTQSSLLENDSDDSINDDESFPLSYLKSKEIVHKELQEEQIQNNHEAKIEMDKKCRKKEEGTKSIMKPAAPQPQKKKVDKKTVLERHGLRLTRPVIEKDEETKFRENLLLAECLNVEENLTGVPPESLIETPFKSYSKNRRNEFLKKYKTPSCLDAYLDCTTSKKKEENNSHVTTAQTLMQTPSSVDHEKAATLKVIKDDAYSEFERNSLNHDKSNQSGPYLHSNGSLYSTMPCFSYDDQYPSQPDLCIEKDKKLERFTSNLSYYDEIDIMCGTRPPPPPPPQLLSPSNLQDSRRWKRSILPTSDLETLFEVDERPGIGSAAANRMKSATRREEKISKPKLPQPPPPKERKSKKESSAEDEKTDQVLKLLEQARNILNLKKRKSEIRQLRRGDYDDNESVNDVNDEVCDIGVRSCNVKRNSSFKDDNKMNIDANLIDVKRNDVVRNFPLRNASRLPQIPTSTILGRQNLGKFTIRPTNSASNYVDTHTKTGYSIYEIDGASSEDSSTGSYNKELYHDTNLLRNRLTNSLELLNETKTINKNNNLKHNGVNLNPRMSKSCGSLARNYDGLNYTSPDDSGIETNNSISIDSNLDLRTSYERKGAHAPPFIRNKTSHDVITTETDVNLKSDFSFRDPLDLHTVEKNKINDSNRLLQDSLHKTKNKNIYNLVQPKPPPTPSRTTTRNKSISRSKDSYNLISPAYNSPNYNSNNSPNTNQLSTALPYDYEAAKYLSDRSRFENTVKQRQPFSSIPMDRYDPPAKLREQVDSRGSWYKRNSSYTAYVDDYLQQNSSPYKRQPSQIFENGIGFDYRLSNHLVLK